MDWDLESAPLADLTWQTEVEESNLNVPVQRPMHGVWCDAIVAEKKAESGSTFRKARGLDVHAGTSISVFSQLLSSLTRLPTVMACWEQTAGPAPISNRCTWPTSQLKLHHARS